MKISFKYVYANMHKIISLSTYTNKQQTHIHYNTDLNMYVVSSKKFRTDCSALYYKTTWTYT